MNDRAPSENSSFTFRTLSAAHPNDLENRLRENHPISSLEVSQINGLISDAEADSHRCAVEISRLHSLIISLENKSEEIKSRLEGYKSLLAPVRKLPAEILTEIAIHYTGRNQLPSTCSALANPSLLILSAVCAHWRNNILSAPSLWASISIPIGPLPPMKFLDLYLERSCQSPLDLRIFQMHPAIAKRITIHSDRWREAVFVNLGYKTHKDTFAAIRGHLPILESLTVDFGDSEFDLDIFELAPKLRSLSLGRSPLPQMIYPWHQITQISHWMGALHDFLRILAISQNLDAAVLKMYDEHSGGVSPAASEGDVRSETHQRLSSFSMTVDKSSFIAELFSAVTFPAVTSVSVSSNAECVDGQWPSDVFASFLLRSSCNLTTFSMEQIPIEDTDLINLTAITHKPYSR